MTVAFAAVMVLVLGGIGVFVYLRFEAELDSTIDAGLQSRASDVAVLVREAGLDSGDRQRLVGRRDTFAEVLGAGGAVLDSSPDVAGEVLLSPSELRRAVKGPLVLDRGSLPGVGSHSRLLATPITVDGRPRVIVVGTSTEARDESLTDLVQLLLFGGPIALLLASLAAYGVAAAALRPVEEMRNRAAQISDAAPEERLPVPPTDDELARLGRTLNEMLERLGEAIEHERAFVADASHELRTPLAILRTELELALAEGRSEAELRAALASALEESDRLIQLSEDLLTIAQTEGGELPLRLETLSLAEPVEAVGRRFGRRAATGDRKIEAKVDGISVEADRLRLDQALASMVDNALRHGEGTISIEANDRGERVELHVTDEGPGFPADLGERAFERFSRGSGPRGDGGAGLGLAIVRTVARAHGGEAHAADREGGGADVWVELPVGGRNALISP